MTLIPAAKVVIIYYLYIGSILVQAKPGPIKIMHPGRGPLSGKRCKGSAMEDEIG